MKRYVSIVGYDPRWPVIYAREKERVLSVTGSRVVAVEHVGSTAVPGLGAKPIVDIMAAVPTLSVADECVVPLESVGYEYVPAYEREVPERRYFRKGPEGVPNRHFHLHVVEHDGSFWRQHLLFRDYLRSSPEVAQQYCYLKRELAERYASDREAYTEAKSSFIESALAQAMTRKRLHLKYLRLPGQTLERYDDLIYESKRVIVGRSIVTSLHSILFDGELVLTAGFPVVYFELIGKWFSIVKVRNLEGKHTGYYCDISTPPKLSEDGSVNVTDLFLDLWVSPDLRHRILDRSELEEALEKKFISKQLYRRVEKEMDKLVELVETNEFPPEFVCDLERRLSL